MIFPRNGQCQPASTAILSPIHPEHRADMMLRSGRRTGKM